MSMHRSANVHEIADRNADRTQNGYGLVAALACVGLLLMIASVVFALPIGAPEVGNETWLVGP